MPGFRRAAVSTLTRLYPFFSGCGTFANHRLVGLLAGESSDTVWARVAGNLGVFAPLNDYVGRAAFYVGDLDRKISWICRHLVRPGDTVLDIGANIGLVTVKLAALVGPGGHVHSFEPNPALVRLLTDAIERNHLTNVTLHGVALGEEESQLELAVPAGNAGKASLVPGKDPSARTVQVPVKRLSAVLSDLQIKHIRLVKIDVEGFEPEVLRGARDWFAAHPPDAILFELNSAPAGITNHPTLQILGELGYDFFSIPKAMLSMRVEKFTAQPGAETGHDFLAIHRGVSSEVAKTLGSK